MADFDVQADGRVEARLTFATAEFLTGVALDRDGDGVVTDDDVAIARDDLRAFVLQEIGVDADGSACSPAFRDATLTEPDGLVLQATYACPSGAANIEVTLFYLSSPPRGRIGAMKGIARIVAGSATTEGLLGGDHRAIALELPPRSHQRVRLTARGVGAAGAAAGLLLLYGSRRWWALRAPWRKRAR